MSTLIDYWTTEVSRIDTALSAVSADLQACRTQGSQARLTLQQATDAVKAQGDSLDAVRKQLALIPMPADGDPLLQALSQALIALAAAQAAQAKADLQWQGLKAQAARLEARQAALQVDMAEAKARQGAVQADAQARKKITDAFTTGIFQGVATDASQALSDFAATAASRVETSFPATDANNPVLLPCIRARKKVVADLLAARLDNAATACTASHDALAQAQQDFDRVCASVRAHFNRAARLADHRLTLKRLASLPAAVPPQTLPILTPAQYARLFDAGKLAAREATLAKLRAVDDLDEAVRAKQIAYDAAYAVAIVAQPDASLTDLQAADLKTPLKDLNKALADRDAAETALTGDAAYADLQAWIAAIPDTLWTALAQLDAAKAELSLLAAGANSLITDLGNKETALADALRAARLAQRKQDAADRAAVAAQDMVAATQDTASRLAQAAARGTLPVL